MYKEKLCYMVCELKVTTEKSNHTIFQSKGFSIFNRKQISC